MGKLKERMGKLKRLQDVYRFPGFVPLAGVRGVFGDPWAVVITLHRRRKKRTAGCAGEDLAPSTTNGRDACATSLVATSGFISSSRFAGSIALGVAA
jgi:hypothetical protein